MFSELAVFIAGVVVFIVGFGLAYRQGKKQGYEKGYRIGLNCSWEQAVDVRNLRIEKEEKE